MSESYGMSWAHLNKPYTSALLRAVHRQFPLVYFSVRFMCDPEGTGDPLEFAHIHIGARNEGESGMLEVENAKNNLYRFVEAWLEGWRARDAIANPPPDGPQW